MTTRVDVEEIEATKGEKLLAFVLTAFLLTGALWVYFHIDRERERRHEPIEVSERDRAAIERHQEALDRLASAKRSASLRRRALVDAREAYRTALDEGRSDPALAADYRAAQAAVERVGEKVDATRRAYRNASPAGRAAERRVDEAERRSLERAAAERRSDRRLSFARRAIFVLLALGAGYLLIGAQRRRRTRWLVTGMAVVGAAALLGVVMAVDYLTDYVDVTDAGVLVLSLAGAAMTIAAFAALQRYLARRLPERRVRRRECPFCGFPARAGPHCEGCGRDVIAECTTCHEPRRVGARHCAACGSP